MKELVSKGVHLIDEPRKMAWGTCIRFVDLDGNEFLIRG